VCSDRGRCYRVSYRDTACRSDRHDLTVEPGVVLATLPAGHYPGLPTANDGRTDSDVAMRSGSATTLMSLFVTFGIVAIGAAAPSFIPALDRLASTAHMAATGEAHGAAAPAMAQSAPANAADFHSRWLDQSAPVSVPGGQTATLTVRFRNTGTASWIRGVVGQQANLGVLGDGAQVAAGWPTPDRAAVQTEAVVPPGGVATFSFAMRAPMSPGSYRLDVRPVIDGTTWMEHEGVYVSLTSQGVVAPGVFDPLLRATTLPTSTLLFIALMVPLVLLALALVATSTRPRRPQSLAPASSR